MKNKLISEFYKNSNDNFLQQGDILYTNILDNEIFLNEKIRLSETVYPYFFQNYPLCVVLNASCDLVFNNKRKPKVECIQLVALSPLKDTLQTLISSNADSGLKLLAANGINIVSEKIHNKISEEFRKIIDGQHKTKFFLPEMKIPDLNNKDKNKLNLPWVAKLDVIVSLRFKQYDAFIKAKTGLKIEPQRASKLAENTASLFNRIALDDIKEVLGDDDYKKWVDEQLEKFYTPIIDLVYQSALPDLKKLSKTTIIHDLQDNVIEILKNHKDVKQYPAEIKILNKIDGILRKYEIDNQIIKKIRNNIEKDGDFKNLFKK
ncbi:MAG: hypothetical protein K2X69_11715 [Silvanigrellaceae bacterium]|nr:hypothetical protein [Silvanigrellaceae bacterium]